MVKKSNHKIYKILASLMSVLHVPIVIAVLFGHYLKGFGSLLYFLLLVITLLSWVILGYCPITKWEYDLRKKYMKVPKYHFEYLHYLGTKLLKIDISVKRIKIYSIIFVSVAILSWLNTHLL